MNLIPTLLYVAFALLSPGVLPDWMREIHIIEILGVLNILLCIPGFARAGLPRLPTTYLVLGILLAGTMSILSTGWLGGTLPIFLVFLPLVVPFYFVVVACQRPRHLVMLASVMAAVMLFVVLQGFIADRTGDYESPYLLQAGMVNGHIFLRHRGLGVLQDPNDLAQALVTTLPLLWLRWKPGALVGNVLLTLLPAAALIFGIYETHSRGGVIALLAVLLFAFKDKLGVVKGVILAGLCGAATIALNFSAGRSVEDDDGERISLWGQALTAFRTHPLFGIGMFRFSDYSDLGLTAHNSYVLCLAEMGIVGYFFWMGAIVTTWTGLSAMLPKKVKKSKFADEADGEPDSAITPELSPAPYGQGFGEPEFGGHAFGDQGFTSTRDVFAFAGQPAAASFALGTGSSVAGPSREGLAGAELEPWEEPEEPIDDATLVRFARLIQTAFVGLLVTAFFLSRTYAMIFYILFGMAAAVQCMYRRQHPELLSQWGSLLKRILLVMAVSIVGLYVFIRAHGVQ